MTIRKLLRKRKPIMRQFILSHDPRFPKPGQKVMFAYYCVDGAFRQKVGTYYPSPARIVMCSGMMYRGIPVTETIPFEYVTFWAHFRGEGMRKHVKTRKVKV